MNPTVSSDPVEHVAAFYRTDDFLENQIAAFVADGLIAGDHVITVATTEHWNRIAERLELRGLAPGRAVQQGRLLILDAHAVLDDITIDGAVSPAKFMSLLTPLLLNASPTRIYGEVVALLVARGDIDAAAEIEEMGQEVAHSCGVNILCGYHAPLMQPDDLTRIQRLHDRSVSEDERKAVSGSFHAVRFYQNGDELSRIVADFILEGHATADPALVISTAAHHLDLVKELRRRELDVDRLQNEGALVLADADELLRQFMRDGMPAPRLFRKTIVPLIEKACAGRKNCTVRAYGEMVDVLWRQGNTVAAVKLETLWNELASTHEFSLLCGYSMGQFYKSADITQICSHHSHVVREFGRRVPANEDVIQ